MPEPHCLLEAFLIGKGSPDWGRWQRDWLLHDRQDDLAAQHPHRQLVPFVGSTGDVPAVPTPALRSIVTVIVGK
jgi:hypothetical protein